MITYPVNVANTRWAIQRISTGEIISRNQVWPVADGSEIPGLDPDFVYLLHIDATPPDYDARLFTLHGVEEVDQPENEIRKTWNTQSRTNEERINAAENEEASRFASIARLEREVLQTRLMLGALLDRVLNTQTMPPKVRSMADKYITKSRRLHRNRDRFNEIKTDIENGIEPDLDTWPENGE